MSWLQGYNARNMILAGTLPQTPLVKLTTLRQTRKQDLRSLASNGKEEEKRK